MGNAKVSTTVWAVADLLPCTSGSCHFVSFLICTNIDRGKNISDGKIVTNGDKPVPCSYFC